MGHKISKATIIKIDGDKEISSPLIEPLSSPEKKRTNDMRNTGVIPKTQPTPADKNKGRIKKKLPKAPPNSPSSEQQISDLIQSHDDLNLQFQSTTLTVPRQLIEQDSNGARRFIIKIQLSKMEDPVIIEQAVKVNATISNTTINENDENGNENDNQNGNNIDNTTNNNNNLNVERSYLNLTFTKNIPCELGTDDEPQIIFQTDSGTEIKLNNLSQLEPRSQDMVTDEFLETFRLDSSDTDNKDFVSEPIPSTSRGLTATALRTVNKKTQPAGLVNNINITLQQMNSYRVRGTELTVCTKSDHLKATNEQNGQLSKSKSEEFKSTHNHDNHEHSKFCCAQKKSVCASKWLCGKCRNTLKKIKESATSVSSSNTSTSSSLSTSGASASASASSSSSSSSTSRNNLHGWLAKRFNSEKSEDILPPRPTSSSASSTSSGASNGARSRQRKEISFWSPRDVLYPIASKYPPSLTNPPPQIVVVQCPQASQIITVNRIVDLEDRIRQLRSTEHTVPGASSHDPSSIDSWHRRSIMLGAAPHGNSVGVRAHSQVDYIHCLVPDLESITSSSFYWGKMDRYEAERLLEGKPEGTFLLRDSAQEEYLFSVTFRKYGRSLHARIEQFNHKFSFDCHDPGVFTANTVTSLLEHYKDPSCVMFFEPMLTNPLHRNFTFSLQQLARATMVTNITYDDIKNLELPHSLKSYLKDYHYKLRVRVKPFDEPLYSCS